MKRAIPFLVLLLATTACSRAADDDGSISEPIIATGGASDAGAMTPDGAATREAGPNIGTTAAPDVAFAYRYGFRLAPDRIAEVQDQHQQICERYTLARCRITGMSYRAATPEDVEATLTFALDPAIARAFGRDAVQRVGAAEGEVTESEITGTDAGTPLRANERGRAELEAELARIETRLRGLDPMSAEKTGLEARRAELRGQVQALREQASAQQESLATTPMVFRYGAGRYAPGPAAPAPLRETAAQSGESALFMLGLLLRLVILLAPWALAGLGVWWLVRRLRRTNTAPGETA